MELNSEYLAKSRNLTLKALTKFSHRLDKLTRSRDLEVAGDTQSFSFSFDVPLSAISFNRQK